MALWQCENCGIFFKRARAGKRPIRFCCSNCYQEYRKKNNYNFSGLFKHGQSPWNKNKKGIHLSPKSEFKKGRQSLNIQPVGTIKKRKTKCGGFRNFIKIADPNKWEILANNIWRAVYGNIPKGLFIHHIDGDKTNDNVDNFCLVTRKSHIEYHRNELIKSRYKKEDRPGKGYIKTSDLSPPSASSTKPNK